MSHKMNKSKTTLLLPKMDFDKSLYVTELKKTSAVQELLFTLVRGCFLSSVIRLIEDLYQPPDHNRYRFAFLYPACFASFSLWNFTRYLEDFIFS